MPGQPLQPSDPPAFGAYRVTGRLGKGGQGVVYLAEDAEGDQVAVKVLNDQWAGDGDLRRRFAKEVRAAQKVASFCTAAILDAQLDEDPPYVVSEFVPGSDLQNTVAKGAPLRGPKLQRLAVSTATALVAIHRAGIVHRDFKPGNVLLGPDGPRVIDFGIARMDDGTATMTNSIVGTPSYMAPEQIEGRGVTDKCDIFAWGCVIAFASTGHAPFGSDTVPAVVHRVISAPPELDGVDEVLRPVVESCLDKNPDNRPSAQALLMRLLGHEGAEDNGSTDDAFQRGERIAQAGGAFTGGQVPPMGHHAPPRTGPQQGFGGYPPHVSDPRAGQNPGTSNPRPMGQPMGTGPGPAYGAHPGAVNPHPGIPGGYPQPQRRPMPPAGPPGANQMATGANPNQTYARPAAGRPMPRPVEQNSVLQQSWVIPAVLMTIVILILFLVLLAVS
ncbi:serine/threonine protein kinase [Nocardiopsis sp. CNR-923]|uniref:serine/threonine-protein kinase n=1 Tax=Nocardiopsis sp. CNR-923 TaxID=1904965 RepID=UPI0009601109|nr:serine/threonine protein kinase [Nocardiopsis sp. CNR-923]OLT28212.1 serine/threonine protein kinase [Nocardiopsis sp. CNR-923]